VSPTLHFNFLKSTVLRGILPNLFIKPYDIPIRMTSKKKRPKGKLVTLNIKIEMTQTRKKYFSQKITYPGYFLKENARLRLAPRNWKKTPETSYHSSCYSNKLHTKGDFT